MKFAVLRFGGSNCDLDVHYVLTSVLGIDADLVWYKDVQGGYDGIVIPGGFSYGDYLRAGAIASRTPAMNTVKKIATEGRPVLGICNGFQILTEAGLLPGALITNRHAKFICRWVNLRVETDSPFTARFRRGSVIRLPIAHRQGNYIAPPHVLEELNRNGRVAFRYTDPSGNPTEESNPNGSLENIAGILGCARKNILGMMPHPERASEEILGSREGREIFKSMADYAASL